MNAAAPQEDRTIALITHISGIFASFLVPLIIWLINKDKPEKGWITDQAKEALNFNITVIMAVVALWIFSIITFGLGALIALPLMLIIGIGALVLFIVAGVKANDGLSYRYPMTIRLIK